MRKSRGIRGNHLTFQLITRTPRSGCSKPSGVRPVKPRAPGAGVLSHLKLGLSLSGRLVLPLSPARLPGGLKGRLGLGLAYRGLIDGRLDDLCSFGGPPGILLGQLGPV
jgi:hypothetical protein